MKTPKQKKPKPFDLVGFIIAYESGNASEEYLLQGFQHLIDTGRAWTLQGCYGRMAQRLIDAGHCHAKN